MPDFCTDQEIYRLYLKHRIICTDTRKIVPGAIFFALKGENFDANTFAKDALSKGCAAAVIDNAEYADESCFLVKDCLETLRNIAILYRQSLDIPVIGITGTNGKTTTKELVRSVLSVKFKTYATQGNLNNHIGVPLTLLSIPNDTQIAIIEMGANHPGEIAGLCEISQPNHGIITNVGKAHLEGFGSFENILKTKTALYDFLREHHGKAFVSGRNPLLTDAAKGMDVCIYGESPEAFLQMTKIEREPTFLSCLLHTKNSTETLEVHTRLVGAYNLENVAAAACAGRYFGLSDTQIKEGIEVYAPTNLRSQNIQAGSNTLIADTYNANPTSMEAAIDNFAALSSTNEKMVILGDMLELGAASEEEHQCVVEHLETLQLKKAFLVGGCFAKTKHPQSFLCYSTADELIDFLRRNPIKNACLLVKGSHGIHLEKAVSFFQENI